MGVCKTREALARYEETLRKVPVSWVERRRRLADKRRTEFMKLFLAIGIVFFLQKQF